MELDKSLVDCPQFVDFASHDSQSVDDSWFHRKNNEQCDAFLRTVDLNTLSNIRHVPQPQRKARQGSYTECHSSGKKRKSHQMRTRQDSRTGADSEEEMEEETAQAEMEREEAAPPAVPKPSRQPVVPPKKAKASESVSAPSKKPKPSEPVCAEKPDKFESMSEKVIKFFHKTPSRFKAKPDPKEKPSTALQPPRCKLTKPVTPNFKTDKRVRGLHVKSAAEREEEEVQQMKAAQFRAHPLPGRRPLSRAASTSQADRCHSSTFDRLAKPKENVETDSAPQKSHKTKQHLGHTVAQSPQLQTKRRAVEHPPSQASTSSESFSGRPEVHPAPHFGRAWQPQLPHKCTEPQPFSFLERDKQKLAEKEARLREKEAAEAKPVFKAQLLPSDSPDELPPKKTRPVTRTQSFELRSNARGDAYWQKFNRAREDSEEMRQQKARFRAKSPEVLRKAPFEPSRVSRFVQPDAPFSLATASRAEERQRFEAEKAAKEAEIEADILREKTEAEAKAEAEAAAQRREAVHKAHPIRQYKPVEPHVPAKPLTLARSPKFSKRFNK